MNKRRFSARNVRKPRSFMLLQWHVTARCDQRCLHCYVRDPRTFRNERDAALGFDDCTRIAEDFCRTCDDWGVRKHIHFSGGDPLLREDFFDLAGYAHARGAELSVLGNPDRVTPSSSRKLRAAGVRHYQLSLDGLEGTHDRIRGRRGSFRDTLRAMTVLKDAGIRVGVMFTLGRHNAHELIDVMRVAVREKVSVFAFDRMIPQGVDGTLREEMLPPGDYRELLLRVFREYHRFSVAGCATRFSLKDKLMVLLYRELGFFRPETMPDDADGGCPVGRSLLTVLADGTVYGCRRLPVAIGKVPAEGLADVFMGAQLHRDLSSPERIDKCGRCELLRFCRGCRAAAYAVSGSYLAPDPQCWKDI